MSHAFEYTLLYMCVAAALTSTWVTYPNNLSITYMACSHVYLPQHQYMHGMHTISSRHSMEAITVMQQCPPPSSLQQCCSQSLSSGLLTPGLTFSRLLLNYYCPTYATCTQPEPNVLIKRTEWHK